MSLIGRLRKSRSNPDPWPRFAYGATFIALVLIVILLGLSLSYHGSGSFPMPRGDVPLGTQLQVRLGGNRYLVTTEEVFETPPPEPVSAFWRVSAGDTVYAVKVSIRNMESRTVTIDPNEYLGITNRDGSGGDANFYGRSDRPSFPNTGGIIPSYRMQLSPGETVVGCIGFEDPVGAKVETVSMGTAYWFAGS